MDADVAVIGLGTIGSMAAWQLSSQGASVLGFEQFGIGHDRSAHGGGSRRFVVASPVEGQTPFTKASYRGYRDLERETGQQVLSYGGTLTIGDPDSERIKKIIASAEKYNLPYEVVEEDEAMLRFPQHRLLPGEVMVLDKLGGVLRPEQMIVAAVNRARRFGARIHTYTEVKDIQLDSTGVTIETSDGARYRVGKVIISNGPWANKLVPSINEIFKVHRIIMNWFIAESPAEFTEDKFPNFSRVSEGKHIIGTPTVDGRMVRVSHGPAFEVIKDADSYDKNVPIDYALKLRDLVKEFLPNLNPDPASTMAFMDGYTTDGFPLVGATKDNEDVILACGFSGAGISQAPAMGEIAANLALNNKITYEIDHLSPSRFGL